MLRTVLSGPLLIAGAISQNAAAQGPDAPTTTLHADARSVVVDVVVTGKDGKAIVGLSQQDFQVSEDGKPQTITFFEPHPAPAGGAAQAGPKSPLSANTFTNIPVGPPADSVNILLLDALNTTTADQVLVRKEIGKYLAEMAPGTSIAVFVLSDRLRMVQGFAQDSATLRETVAREIAKPELTTMPQSQSAPGKHAASARGPQFEANYRTATTLEALGQLARCLAGIPGRKNLLWFASYNPLLLSASSSGPGSDAGTSTTNPTGDSPYYERSRKAVSALADAQVSVYPIEASGVEADSLTDASTVPTDYQNRSPISYETATLREGAKDRNILHLTMDQLARDTGGKATYSQNGLKEAIAEDIDNGSRYYTLAYTPTNRSEGGKERKIEVKIVSAKYNLAYRRSYFEDNPGETRAENADRGKDPLHSLMGRGMPDFTELRYRTHIVPANPQPAAGAPRAGENSTLKPPLTRYGVDFTLSTGGLSLVAEPDGVRQGKIEVAMVAYSRDGRPLNWMVRLVALVIRPNQYAMAQGSGIPFHLDIDVPPGEIYLRSGVYDTASGKAGTLEIPLNAIQSVEN
jgi:VWFA-related protein